jgi:hypothetical protein
MTAKARRLVSEDSTLSLDLELTRCAHGEEHLHRVEEEEHDEQRDGRSERQTQCMRRVQRGEAGIYAEEIF